MIYYNGKVEEQLKDLTKTSKSMNEYMASDLASARKRRPRNEFEDTWVDRVIAGLILIAMIALALGAFYYGGKLVVEGILFAEERRATAECEKWADEAKVFEEYFIVGWQKEQCDTYGIEIDAPLKNYKD